MNFLEKDVNEIIPNLWLGNCKAAYDKGFLFKYNIKNIITIMDNFDEQFRFSHITYLIIPLSDKNICSKNVFNIFESTNEFIDNSLKCNNPILVHCKRGHHRSASIIAAYLIKYLNINYNVAINYINYLRPLALRRDTCISRGLFSYYLMVNNIKNCEIMCFNHNGKFNCKCKYID